MILVEAENRAALIGGSREDFNEKNFFQSDFTTFRDKLSARGWGVDVLFDGDKFKIPGSEKATNENIDRTIQGLKDKTGKGDKVLLFFHAHGLKRDRGFMKLNGGRIEWAYGCKPFEGLHRHPSRLPLPSRLWCPSYFGNPCLTRRSPLPIAKFAWPMLSVS